MPEPQSLKANAMRTSARSDFHYLPRTVVRNRACPIKFLSKETRQITHNSIFADFPFRIFVSEIPPPKPEGRQQIEPRFKVVITDKIQNHTFKDQPPPGTPPLHSTINQQRLTENRARLALPRTSAPGFQKPDPPYWRDEQDSGFGHLVNAKSSTF